MRKQINVWDVFLSCYCLIILSFSCTHLLHVRFNSKVFWVFFIRNFAGVCVAQEMKRCSVVVIMLPQLSVLVSVWPPKRHHSQADISKCNWVKYNVSVAVAVKSHHMHFAQHVIWRPGGNNMLVCGSCDITEIWHTGRHSEWSSYITCFFTKEHDTLSWGDLHVSIAVLMSKLSPLSTQMPTWRTRTVWLCLWQYMLVTKFLMKDLK